MATFKKLTVKKYEALNALAVSEPSVKRGIIFEYTGGTGKTSAVQLHGDGFTPVDGKTTSVFHAFRNAVALYWVCRKWELKLKDSNTGISTKLRANPTRILIGLEDGTTAFEWDSVTSILERVGLLPNSSELNKIKLPESLTSSEVSDDDDAAFVFNAWKVLDRESRQHINRSAGAAFNALKTRFVFDDSEEPETETKPEAPVKKTGKKSK